MEPESRPNPGPKVDPERGFNPASKTESKPKPSSDFFFSKRNPAAAVYSEKVRAVQHTKVQCSTLFSVQVYQLSMRM